MYVHNVHNVYNVYNVYNVHNVYNDYNVYNVRNVYNVYNVCIVYKVCFGVLRWAQLHALRGPRPAAARPKQIVHFIL